jgi:hypothetical protein
MKLILELTLLWSLVSVAYGALKAGSVHYRINHSSAARTTRFMVEMACMKGKKS